MTDNTITCPHCKQHFEISEALKHDIEEKVIRDERKKFEAELREEVKKAEEQAKNKTLKTLESKIKDSKEEIVEEKKRNKELIEQLKDTNRQMRELRRKKEETELQMEKKLAEEEEKIWKEAREKSEAEQKLKLREKQKQLEDALKKNEELRRKLQQGSQQMQGEVLELDLEEILSGEFPNDTIEPVGKGVSGADIRQIVKSPKGINCGVVLWESKRTKNWNDGWIKKLKNDLRSERANIPVIVSEALPTEAKEGIGFKEGVWICSPKFALDLARLFRKNLLEVGYERAIATHRSEKADMIYAFVTSHEFRQQVEAIVEVYKEMQEQIDKERRVYEKNWSRREAQIKRVIVSAATIYGRMQGFAGAAMPQIKGLELLELESGEE